MTRHVAAIAIFLCLNVSSLSAQIAGSHGVELTVKVASANVHKFPSIASPVIGKAQRGSVLVINRNLGSWVEVGWPGGEGGIAFLHVNAGSISGRIPVDPNRVVAPPGRPMSMPTPAVASATTGAEQMNIAADAPPRQVYIALPNHHIGLGVRMTPTAQGFGATSRAWLGSRVGVQFEVSRHHLDNINSPAGMTSMQFAPSALYSLPNVVTDSLWLRPYVGGGVSFNRLSSSAALTGSPVDTSMGYQAFGGAETTLAGLPQFSLSADAGYRRARSTFAGFDKDRIAIAISGHWYVK
jgi:hypothetical protein